MKNLMMILIMTALTTVSLAAKAESVVAQSLAKIEGVAMKGFYVLNPRAFSDEGKGKAAILIDDVRETANSLRFRLKYNTGLGGGWLDSFSMTPNGDEVFEVQMMRTEPTYYLRAVGLTTGVKLFISGLDRSQISFQLNQSEDDAYVIYINR